jgi:hypothetical protein
MIDQIINHAAGSKQVESTGIGYLYALRGLCIIMQVHKVSKAT